MLTQPDFNAIYIVHCQVARVDGDRPSPIFIAYSDFHSRQKLQLGVLELRLHRQPPYPTNAQALIVTSHAVDLAMLHIEMGWQMPERILDLLIEFRNITNGSSVVGGPGLVGALIWYGLPAPVGLPDQGSLRQVWRRLEAVSELFRRMRPNIDWGRAFLRGRYLIAVAKIELTGLPIDSAALQWLCSNWSAVQQELVTQVDRRFRLYWNGRFQTDQFERFLIERQIDWPRDPSGALNLSDEVFKEMSRTHAELVVLRELRTVLGTFRPIGIAVGKDKRNRTSLRPFASRTGRNQPSANAFIFGNAAPARFLVQPEPGRGLALIDWCQQEFGIAAALSEDGGMTAAYLGEDPYIKFAELAGAAPVGATAKTHPAVREQYKTCALGVQYGMSARGLARILGNSLSAATNLLEHHKRVFPKFWLWSDDIESRGLLYGELHSVFGWQVKVDADANPRFLRNFPMQANGAEMMRLACCLVTEAGIEVCTPLHDALLIEAPLADLEIAVGQTQRLMAEASSVVLDGFELRSEAKIVRHPDRLGDTHKSVVWSAIQRLI